jgi:hypothetical protein
VIKASGVKDKIAAQVGNTEDRFATVFHWQAAQPPTEPRRRHATAPFYWERHPPTAALPREALQRRRARPTSAGRSRRAGKKGTCAMPASSTTPDPHDRYRRMRVTHPFLPLAGRDLEFVEQRQNCGEDRVCLHDEDGSCSRCQPGGTTQLRLTHPW